MEPELTHATGESPAGRLFDELLVWDDRHRPEAGPLQMAIDEAAYRLAASPILRLYAWNGMWVSFGYFQKRGDVAVAHPGLPLIRRWTGGGSVVHGFDLTYALTVPRSHPFAALPVRESYRAIHAILCGVLGSGYLLASSPGGAEHGRCFAGHTCDDVLHDGQKVAGAAQRRGRSGLLHQGSIVVASDVANRVAEAFPLALGNRVLVSGTPVAVLDFARDLHAARYGGARWMDLR